MSHTRDQRHPADPCSTSLFVTYTPVHYTLIKDGNRCNPATQVLRPIDRGESISDIRAENLLTILRANADSENERKMALSST